MLLSFLILIYNSRNFKGLLDFINNDFFLMIYNSRNFKGLLDPLMASLGFISTTVEILRVS